MFEEETVSLQDGQAVLDLAEGFVQCLRQSLRDAIRGGRAELLPTDFLELGGRCLRLLPALERSGLLTPDVGARYADQLEALAEEQESASVEARRDLPSGLDLLVLATSRDRQTTVH